MTRMLAIEGPPLALVGTEKPAPAPYPSSLKDAEEKILVEEVEEAEDCIPDGGLRAWLVVFGVSLGMGAFIGPMNAWGTWQAYYQDNLLQDRSSSDIAWIGSVQTAAGRLPGTRDLGPLFNLSEFKKPACSVYVLSLIINNLALNNALAYITVSAIDEGFDANFSYDLLAIVNAVMTLGQLVGGLLADCYDPLDVLIGSTLLDAVVNFAWPFATNVAALVVITVLIGLSIGGVYASMVQPFERMGRLADVGMRMGMGFTLITGGLVAGSPISGAIFDATGSYKNVGYYSELGQYEVGSLIT
ncbi:MFS general substrate transporter [Ganoderma sinense ZZ0214-1]|uniref:MFS general substrate transporter n=1 Tax=Ganoderma sinense ZZ0214-1 TaxID=1077348 RepID=A0A2G8S2E5_9APHY|nr:MFS general substrate transporter [Ganoderma sinense ZZ0214-1]